MRFGVAGYPLAFNDSVYRKDRMKIFQWLSELGLDAFEMQMTYGPRTTKQNCLEIRRLAEEFKLKLSIHGSYFIVLTSNDEKKIVQSIDTLKRTYELADILGANVVVLHPGPMYGLQSHILVQRLIENANKFMTQIGSSDIGLFLETAGKKGQIGSIDEIVELCSQIPQSFPCIDFGHVHARTGGTLGSPFAIDSFFDSLKQMDFFKKFGRYHFHYTPIHYGPKGEISHKAIEDIIEPNQQGILFGIDEAITQYHPRFEQILLNLLPYNLDCTVISETHDSQERGAMAMKKEFQKLLTKKVKKQVRTESEF